MATPPTTGGSTTAASEPVPQTGFFDALDREAQQAANSLGVFRRTIVADVTPFMQNFVNIAGKGVLSAVERAEFQLIDLSLASRREMIAQVEDRAGTTVELARILETATGFNAQSLRDYSTAADSALGQLKVNFFKTMNELADERVAFADGTEVTMAELHTNLNEVVSTYNKAYLDDNRLYTFASKAMNKDFASQAQLAVDNLKISTRDLNFIAAVELSRTGQISKDSLLEFEKTVAATVAVSGLAPQKVAEDLLKIQKNFSAFGDIADERAGALIKTMSRLGLEVSDVATMATRFQSFDQAAQAMSNLAASTGVTLDTLELFELANTDQEAFIISLREQLQAQGLEFENMNVLQQKQVAAALGIDPRGLQRMLNDNLSVVESSRYQLEEKMSIMTEEETDRFINSLSSLREASTATAEQIATARAQAREASLGLASELERSYRSMLATIKDASDIVKGDRDAQQDLLRALEETLRQINDASEKADIRGRQEAEAARRSASAPPPPPPTSTPQSNVIEMAEASAPATPRSGGVSLSPAGATSAPAEPVVPMAPVGGAPVAVPVAPAPTVGPPPGGGPAAPGGAGGGSAGGGAGGAGSTDSGSGAASAPIEMAKNEERVYRKKVIFDCEFDTSKLGPFADAIAVRFSEFGAVIGDDNVDFIGLT